MRVLFSFILAMFMATAHATPPPDFHLQFNGEQIVHRQSDWQYATRTDTFKVYVEKGMIGYKNETFEFHSYVEYVPPKQFDYIDGKTKRIYTFGVLSCSEGKLYLLLDLYTDENNIVHFRNENDMGTFVSDMNAPNTVRNDVYNLICKDSI